MKILLIDDMRTYVGAEVARDFFTGLQMIMDGGWDLLLLDHDLGPDSVRHGKEWTGYDVMCWLEENQKYLPGRVQCVSSNPVGRKKIETVIRKLYSD